MVIIANMARTYQTITVESLSLKVAYAQPSKLLATGVNVANRLQHCRGDPCLSLLNTNFDGFRSSGFRSHPRRRRRTHPQAFAALSLLPQLSAADVNPKATVQLKEQVLEFRWHLKIGELEEVARGIGPPAHNENAP